MSGPGRGYYVRRLSLHFLREWEEWLGVRPTLDHINGILAGSRKVNGQRTVYTRDVSGKYKPEKQLAQFWSNDAGVLIRVDTDKHTAVTVITPAKERMEFGDAR